MIKLNKSTIAGLTALTIVAGSFAATATPASAGSLNVAPALSSASMEEGKVTQVRHRRWHRRGWRRGHGAAAAAGIIGFAAGAALAAQAHRGDCWYEIVRKKRRNRWGERVIIKKRVLVCD